MKFIDRLHTMDIVLASASPRRSELLGAMGLKFRQLVKETPEKWPQGLAISEIPSYLAREKSACFDLEVNDQSVLLITADTIVVLDDQVMNKPASVAEAEKMLRALSGRWHSVLSGLCLRTSRKEICITDTTRVLFRELLDEEISWYIKNYRPFDKAGSYGIQEWIDRKSVV